MNTARKLLSVAVVAFSLSACATSGTAMNAPPEGTAKVDGTYVAAVENAAHKAPVRVRVIWVNPPYAADED